MATNVRKSLNGNIRHVFEELHFVLTSMGNTSCDWSRAAAITERWDVFIVNDTAAKNCSRLDFL